MPRKFALLIAASISVAEAACSIVPADTSFESLSGSIVQPDFASLVPGSVVVVRLEDLSRHDGRADVVAEQRIERPTQMPISFRLKYDGGEIDPKHRYVVTASVYSGREITFSTEDPQRVIIDGNSKRIRLVLGRTAALSPTPVSP